MGHVHRDCKCQVGAHLVVAHVTSINSLFTLVCLCQNVLLEVTGRAKVTLLFSEHNTNNTNCLVRVGGGFRYLPDTIVFMSLCIIKLI